ncbi:hypothetical protein D6C81_10451 [Aureobasidium pullulans]|nr:hypothetical protein D6C81_10451 [Aureobasidium pullulans]
MASSQQRETPSPDDGQAEINRADQYTIGWICALPIELAAAVKMLDVEHQRLPPPPGDDNSYRFGRIGDHNIVIGCLPSGRAGLVSASSVATQMMSAFRQIRVGLMVGIGGGVPSEDNDVHLGDIVVSHPNGQHGGVAQYDFGKARPDGIFERIGSLNAPPNALLTALTDVRAAEEMDELKIVDYLSRLTDRLPPYAYPSKLTDCLYQPKYSHIGGRNCIRCDSENSVVREKRSTNGPRIHYGTIASGNMVMKDAIERDQISQALGGVLCFEMKAAGLMNNFPCLVIRGISDYSDSHKNDGWQRYAAATAAAFAKDLLYEADGFAADQELRDVRYSLVIVGPLLTSLEGATEREMLDWLSSSPKLSNIQSDTRDCRVYETGDWLVQDSRYSMWFQTGGLIWLHGVGEFIRTRSSDMMLTRFSWLWKNCAKVCIRLHTLLSKYLTRFSSRIIDDLKERCIPLSNTRVAYWYFQFSDSSTQNITHMLRSILRQLSPSPLPHQIYRLWSQHFHIQSEPSRAELLEVISDLVKSQEVVYLVLDALDEYPAEKSPERRTLLMTIKELMTSCAPSLRCLVTSRREPDIQQELESVAYSIIDVDPAMQEDVGKLVAFALSQDSIRRWGDTLVSFASTKLLDAQERLERRFRWTDLQIKRLRNCPTEYHFRTALDTIPETLEETYHQALKTIPRIYQDAVRTILIWLTSSFREMTSIEIAATVQFQGIQDVLRTCSSVLVTIIDGDTQDTIKLAHFTVKEFLIRRLHHDESHHWYRFTSQLAHCYIAKQTLECLFGPSDLPRWQCLLGPPASPKWQELRRYAIRYWPDHAKHNDGSSPWDPVQAKVNAILQNDSRKELVPWLKSECPIELSYNPDRTTPLYFACLLGLLQAAEYYWQSPTQLPEKRDGRFKTAVNAAAVMGHHGLFSWLMHPDRCVRNLITGNGRTFIDVSFIIENIQKSPRHILSVISTSPWEFPAGKKIVHVEAANLHGQGREIIEYLLDETDTIRDIDEDLVESASHNHLNPTILEALAERHVEEFPISCRTLVAVAGLSLDAFGKIIDARSADVDLNGHILLSIAEVPSGIDAIQMLLDRNMSVIITDTLVESLATSPFGSDIMMLLMKNSKFEQDLTSEGIATIAGRFDLKVLDRLLKIQRCAILEPLEIINQLAYNCYLRKAERNHPPTSRKLSREYRPALVRSDARSIMASMHGLVIYMGPRVISLITENIVGLSVIGSRFSTVRSLPQRLPSHIVVSEEGLKAAVLNMKSVSYLKRVSETHVLKHPTTITVDQEFITDTWTPGNISLFTEQDGRLEHSRTSLSPFSPLPDHVVSKVRPDKVFSAAVKDYKDVIYVEQSFLWTSGILGPAGSSSEQIGSHDSATESSSEHNSSSPELDPSRWDFDPFKTSLFGLPLQHDLPISRACLKRCDWFESSPAFTPPQANNDVQGLEAEGASSIVQWTTPGPSRSVSPYHSPRSSRGSSPGSFISFSTYWTDLLKACPIPVIPDILDTWDPQATDEIRDEIATQARSRWLIERDNPTSNRNRPYTGDWRSTELDL